ncbi:MAG: urease accessory protein UreD, partial [Planctomycetota bacterium]|nr:urease accessory protein UreD [Planctomycetota bacterium]
LEEVSAQGLRARPDVLAAASPLPDGDGVLLRLAAVSVEEGMRRLRALLAFLVPMLADDPWARKW